MLGVIILFLLEAPALKSWGFAFIDIPYADIEANNLTTGNSRRIFVLTTKIILSHMKHTINFSYCQPVVNYQAAHVLASEKSIELQGVVVVNKKDPELPLTVREVKDMSDLLDNPGTIFGVYIKGRRFSLRGVRLYFHLSAMKLETA